VQERLMLAIERELASGVAEPGLAGGAAELQLAGGAA
jgi:hypothetical protein